MTKKIFNKNLIEKILAIVFLLVLWQILALIVHNDILVVSPIDVIVRLTTIWTEDGFFTSILFSFERISLGFALGLLIGAILATISSKVHIVKVILNPLMTTLKTIPVASFIIIALIWLNASNLSVFISFIMVLPVIYTNLLLGIESIPQRYVYLEKVYKIPYFRKLTGIVLPLIKPHLFSACSIALGLAWKAGIAAEIIGIPSGSIGERLYQTKIYLETPDLFAWTVIIILISVLFEKLFLFILRKLYTLMER